MSIFTRVEGKKMEKVTVVKKIKHENTPPDSFSLTERHKNKFFKSYSILSPAIEFSKNNFSLPVFSKDKEKNEGKKDYFVCSYDKVIRILSNNTVNNCYEIIKADIPCNLFVDVDIDLVINLLNEEALETLHNEFIHNVKKYFVFMKFADREDDVSLSCLDSTTKVKFSRHYIFRTVKGWFKNVNHCGAFMRNFANHLYELEGVRDPKESKWWFKIKEPKKVTSKFEGGGFLGDLTVYNTNRNFRTWKSAKMGRLNVFTFYPPPSPPPPPQEETEENIKNIKNYFVQSDCELTEEKLLYCKEWNGGEPISTSDVRFGRFDVVEKMISGYKDLLKFYNTDFDYYTVWDMFGQQGRSFSFDFGTHFKSHTFFGNKDTFTQFIKAKTPHAIHIGHISSGTTVKKELVFDIDVTDYTYNETNIRLCCGNEGKLCKKCWPLIVLAYYMLETLLKEVFGFEDVKFFFSGSKGIHCWVFDKKIFTMGYNERTEIITFLRRNELYKRPYIVNYLKENERINALVQNMCDSDNFIISKDVDPLLQLAPRFDEAVTIGATHLLKCPLSLHPKTKKMCCELTSDVVDEFFVE